MTGPSPPPPPAQRPLQLLAPTCYNMMGMSADNLISQYSRPNSEINFSTPFPTCEVGYNSLPYDSFGVGPYGQRVIPRSLSQCQAQIKNNGHDLLQHGTGVFHPTRVSTEYRRANYTNNIRERRTRQVGGREDNDNCQNERWVKKEECHNYSLPFKNESRGKNKKNKKKNGGSEKKEECYVPNLPPGIVLPMEWPYPDSY